MMRTLLILLTCAATKVLTADNAKAMNAGLRTNEGAAHVLVQDNEITFGNIVCTLCRDYSAIYVTEGGLSNDNSAIRNNTIHFLNSGSSRYGINLLSADDWLVAENTLLMANNALNETGIWLQGCRRAEVSCNTVMGASTDYVLKGQTAIRNAMGSDPLISCNDVDKTTHGILFNGTAYGTDLRGNHIRRHKWGLYLDNTAIIDAQVLKGNLWYNNAPTGGWSAFYANTFNAGLYPFHYNPATIGGGNTQPPSSSPAGWFDPVSGTNYDCADDHEEDYCSQFTGKRGKDYVYSLDEKIATDSLENDPYTDETKWILKGDLYKKLDEHPALLDSLPDLADFYEAMEGSLIAAFKQVDDGQLALYDLDSSVVATLQQNRQQLEDLMTLVKAGMEQLADTNLTNTQQQALLATLGGYQQAIRDLTEYNATAMQLAATTKALTADNVKAVNAGLGTSELIETNQKQVNEVYLATIAKDVKEFTTEQATELFAIADQCPMMGGNAVYRARALYSIIDEEQVYDDETLCLLHGIITKRLTEPTPNTVSVIPNPASDEATLVLTMEHDMPSMLIIFDALGSEVARHVVPTGSQRHAFSTAALAPALYHYKVLMADSVIGNGKLTIVR